MIIRLCAGLFLFAATVFGQTLVHEIVGGPSFPTLGSAVTGLGDVNGDGFPDFATAGLVPAGTGAQVGRVRCYSGASAALLYEQTTTQTPFSPLTRIRLVNTGDLTGDGVDDLAASVVDGDISIAPGSVFVYDGVNGTRLYTLISSETNDGFGVAMASGVDVNQDGLSDIAVCAPSSSTAGTVRLFSGGTGSPLVSVTPSILGMALSGSSLAFVADRDGDGIADLAMGTSWSNELSFVSSTTGSLVSVLLGPPFSPFCCGWGGCYGFAPGFGYSISSLSDVDGDGVRDLAVSYPNHINQQCVPETVLLYSGGSGALLHGFSTEASPGLASIPDIDGDNVDEIAVCNGPTSSEVRVFSAVSGSQLFAAPLPPGAPPSYLVHPMYSGQIPNQAAGLGDLDGDGRGELIVGHGEGGLLRVWSSSDIVASMTTLGTPGGFGPLLPTLTSTMPLMGSVLDLTLISGLPAAQGFLVLAPAPAAPFPIMPGFVIYPNLSAASSWMAFPISLSNAGYWNVSSWIPAHPPLAGTEAIIQAVFPSPLGLSGTLVSNGLHLRVGY